MGLFSNAAFKEPPTPYAGLIDGELAYSAPHVLVSGPSGVGKSRRVLGPAICLWDGPVVAVSSKPDLIDLCLEHRLNINGFGKTYILDLSGEVPDDVVPNGVRKVRVDPTSLIRNDDDALDMATILMQSGSAGAGGDSKQDGDAFWETISTAPLAAILRAAGKDGIGWVRGAVGLLDDGKSSENNNDPCWTNAMVRLDKMGSEMLSAELESAAKLDSKMRDSVMVTMKSAIAPWLRSNVSGVPGQLAFTPELLTHPNSTLFVVAPATGVAAGAAVSVVDFISKRWRANQTERVKLPRLLLVVDELCNTMPWPKLPTVVTESRAMGIHILAAVQATAQFAKRYGSDGMTELREVFPAVLLLLGAPEKDMLENAAWWQGKQSQDSISIDHNGRHSQQGQMAEVISAQSLLPKDINHGRLLRGRKPGVTPTYSEAGIMVDLVDISAMDFVTV